MDGNNQFRYAVVYYVPDPTRTERTPIGVIMTGIGFVATRFVSSWAHVLRADPDCDLDFLAAIESELGRILQRGDRESAWQQLEEWSNAIQVSERGWLRTNSPEMALDRLAKHYL